MNEQPLQDEQAWTSSDSLIPTTPAKQVKQRFKFKRWTLGTILLLLGITVSLVRSINFNPESRTEIRLLPVKTTQVKPVQSYSVMQTYTGEVAATRASELGFEQAGKIVWLKVDRGDRVKAGAAIAKLDTRNLEAQRLQLVAQKERALAILAELQNGPRTEDIAAARAQVNDLESQLQLEQIKRDRRENLWRDGAISREQFDEFAYGSNALSERLASARSNLSELLAGTRKEQIAAAQAEIKHLEARIADIEITIAKSTITAPFAGTIAARRLDEGTVVSSGMAVVRLVEDVSPEVEIGVPVGVAAQVKPGSKQQVKIGSKIYQAKVASVLPEINPETRTRSIVLKLAPTALFSVSPREIARLQVKQTVAGEGYWLPLPALVRGERGLWACYVVVEAPDKAATQSQAFRVEKRELEVLHTAGDRALVRGTIQPGDRVIGAGTQRLVPGQLVRLVN